MKIFIVNSHSCLNSGDSGIVLAQIRFLKKYFPNVVITLTSRTPEIDKRMYSSMGMKLLPPVIPAPSVFSRNKDKILRSIENLIAFSSKKDLVREMQRSDLIISSGGGCFWSNRKFFPGPMFFQNYFHVKLACILKRPLIFFPQSLGPFQNSVAPRVLKDVLVADNVLKIFVRERASFDFISNLLRQNDINEKVTICPDLAFYLHKGGHRLISSGDINLPRPIVAVTLREWDFPEVKSKKNKVKRKKAYLSAFKEVCQNIYRMRGGSIIIFAQARGPGDFENDIYISRSLFKELRGGVPDKHLLFIDLPAAVSPYHIIDILSQVDLIIATRLHSAIFALISGVPAISVEYQPKSKGVMELLELERYCVSIDKIDADQILHLVEDVLSRRAEISSKILEEVRNIRKTVEEKLESSIKSFL